ncbi:hypothetical protein JTM05_34835, partial [Pseudomonas aeruginosa]|nr:hypothetical protein [Pseudomonas aeruginosa]
GIGQFRFFRSGGIAADHAVRRRRTAAAYASRSSSKRVYTLNKLQDKTASRFEQRLRWPRKDEAQGWADLLPTPMQLEV